MAFILVTLALYRLFRDVSRTHASLMVILFALSVPISFLNVVNEVAALNLFKGADFLSIVDKSQREAIAMLFLRLHGQGLQLAAVFWGLWLFPFGILVMRSGFIPRILGVLLIINGFAYPIVSVTSLLAPDYTDVVNRWAMIAETANCGSCCGCSFGCGRSPQPKRDPDPRRRRMSPAEPAD